MLKIVQELSNLMALWRREYRGILQSISYIIVEGIYICWIHKSKDREFKSSICLIQLSNPQMLNFLPDCLWKVKEATMHKYIGKFSFNSIHWSFLKVC